MRYRSSRLRYTESNPIGKFPGLLLLLVFGLLGWMVACNLAVASHPTAGPQRYAFYLDNWAEDDGDNGLAALDPVTLKDLPNGRTLKSRIVSADGSTGVTMEYLKGRASLKPEDILIVVYDLQSGVERGRFHPPVRGLVSSLSEDGRRLLLQSDPYIRSPYPPPVEWHVVNTNSGKLLFEVKDDDNSCFRQRGLLDPAGERIYCMVDPYSSEGDGPKAMQIVAYDVKSGRKVKELELPEILIGGSQSELNGQLVEEFLEPAVALSPDGRRLAIVHAGADKITLINARNLTVEKTHSLKRQESLWDWFAPGVAYAKGEMQGTIRQAVFSPDGRHLYVFTQEVWVRPEDAPDERGLWLVNLEQGSIMAEALPEYQIQWLRPAPDGTVYVFGTTEERLWPYQIRETSPSKLWRLDGLTLEILVERAFTGYRNGQVVKEAPS